MKNISIYTCLCNTQLYTKGIKSNGGSFIKKYKAAEVAKQLGIESPEIRELITKIAMDRNIADEYIHVVENTDCRDKYYFYENSLAYIRNYIFLYGIFGSHKVVYNILNHKLKDYEVKGKFNRKIDYIGKKYSIYKNLLYNEQNLLDMIINKNNDFYSKVIEEDNKLLSVKVIEEIEKNIEKNPKQLIDLVKAQIEIGELLPAKENIEKIIELAPVNLEAYFLKAKVLLRLMNKPSKKISSYRVTQENMETSSGWHTYEDLIMEEYAEIEKLKRNRYDTYLEIYNLLKKSESYSSYEMKKECENEIFRTLYIKYFYNNFVSLNITNHLKGQKEKLKKYRETGELELPEKGFNKSFVDMVLDIVVKPNSVNFKDEKFIQMGIEALHFYFMVDFEKYIKYADFYFKSLKNMDLSHISPQVLSTYFSHCHKKTNYNSHISVFQEHFYMNLSEAEIVEFNERLSKNAKEEAKGQNEARSLNLIKVKNFKILYKLQKYEELLSQMESSLDKLRGNPENYVMVAYGSMELVFVMAKNNIANIKYEETIKNIEKLLVIDKEMYKKYGQYNSPAWKSETQHVEEAYWTDNEDILGNWFESDYTIEKNLEDLVYSLEESITEENQSLRLEKIKKFLHV